VLEDAFANIPSEEVILGVLKAATWETSPRRWPASTADGERVTANGHQRVVGSQLK